MKLIASCNVIFYLYLTYMFLMSPVDMELMLLNNNYSDDVQPMCYLKSTEKIAPCSNENMLQACLNIYTGVIEECGDKTFIPLCYLPNILRYVVNCKNTSMNLCLSLSSKVKSLEVCKNFPTKACLGKKNKLEFCGSRSKRQEPQPPQLDVDGYYASCESCNVSVVMTLDEESNERPIIEIRSEPMKEEDSQQLY